MFKVISALVLALVAQQVTAVKIPAALDVEQVSLVLHFNLKLAMREKRITMLDQTMGTQLLPRLRLHNQRLMFLKV